MNQILQKVRQAKRRLFFQALILNLPKFLFLCLSIAFAAILLPKLFAIDFLASAQADRLWLNGWAWGAVGLAVLTAVFWTWVYRDSTETAAHQIDKSYGLKERVSTSISLAEKHQKDPFAEAVVRDTSNRISDVEISDQFPVQPNRWSLIPLIPALAIIGITFLPQASSVADPTALTDVKKEENNPKKLKKGALKKKKTPVSNPKTNGEIEASKVLNKKVDALRRKMSNEKLSKKKTLMSINDIKKSIKKEQAKLGKTKAFKDMLNEFKKSKSGLAKKINDAVKNGDFKKAQNALKKFADKLAKGEISKKEAEKIAKELENLKKEFEKKKRDFENKKGDLDRQIEQAKKKGNEEKAAELQQQKEELEKQNRQQQQMDNICKNCKQIADAMKNAGKNKDGKPNQEQMKQMKDAMKNLQKQLKEMDMDKKQAQELKELMDKMQQMQKECNGQCEGEGNGKNKPGNARKKKNGRGMGPGKGEGERPEAETDTKFRDSQVRPKVNGRGEVAKIGKVGGANRKGISLADIRKNMQDAAETRAITPDNPQGIPSHLKNHVRDYFKKDRSNR